MTKTTASMFTGGGLFDIGATRAGYTPVWGIEKFDKIASVARLNGLPVITADVTEMDFSTLDRPDHLHASPPCPNFSVANNDKGETPLDIAMAQAVRRALLQFKPDTFTLENVVGYRSSESFKIITGTLSDLGYWWDADNLNAADFGVPQTRVRLFVRASRGLLRGYPPPVKWRGWYEAIEDLIPTLPDAEFAPWQIARLPEEYKTFLTGQGTYSTPKDAHEPADTITSNSNQSGMKAFVMQVQGEGGKGYREQFEPMQTPTTVHGAGKFKAFIVGDQKRQMADSDRPAFTVRAGESGGYPPRAFVLDGQSNKHGESVTIRQGENRIFTLSASGERRPARAFVGRVVKMTVQALGRFQTVPDTYKGLTVKINGNAVPCLLSQKVLETL
jgi:site-specific DNA-cytosine methylase